MSQSRNPNRIRPAGTRLDVSVEGGPTGRAGLIASAVLHAGIIAATLYTFSHSTLQFADQAPPVVPVDLVTIGEKTNLMPTVREQPKLEKQEIQPPQHLDALQPVTPPKVEEAEPAPAPDHVASEPVLKKPVPLIQPKVKPQTQPLAEKKKPAEEDFSSLLNKLTAPSAAPKNARIANRTTQGFGAQNAMTMDLVDSLRNQIAQCWSPPIGAPRGEELVVEFDLFLNQDGSVARAPQLTASSQSAAASDTYTRAAADAAQRAIYECAPYKLPADRYSQWREINPFHFDPRQMMGQ